MEGEPRREEDAFQAMLMLWPLYVCSQRISEIHQRAARIVRGEDTLEAAVERIRHPRPLPLRREMRYKLRWAWEDFSFRLGRLRAPRGD